MRKKFHSGQNYYDYIYIFFSCVLKDAEISKVRWILIIHQYNITEYHNYACTSIISPLGVIGFLKDALTRRTQVPGMEARL